MEAKRRRVEGAGEWKAHWDSNHNQTFWHNEATGESTWTPPPPPPAPELPAGPPQHVQPEARASQWDRHWDVTHQRHYWHNETTGETTWECPDPAQGSDHLALTLPPPRQTHAQAAEVPAGEWEQGTVKLWNDQKGFGFIRPDDGSQDVFVHRKSFAGQGREGRLLPGQRVYYSPAVPNPKGAPGTITTHKLFGPGVDAGPQPGQLTGSVKFWNDAKGFGFIQAADGSQDVFVLRRSFSATRAGVLIAGSTVHYDPPVPNPKGSPGSIITHRVHGPGVRPE
eukprot:TRINITY_DN30692_c0_g1_i1.p1 TRINITY_DN30692_c0_g1~~TRINITY_DN30692_c0_g1_i1.p1  ORF type:complete len:313 (+),score=9.14 TRINITY_DN30692_c0_g1_i1:98-940(+)